MSTSLVLVREPVVLTPTLGNQLTVRKKLQQLGVQPYNARSVARYKRLQLKRYSSVRTQIVLFVWRYLFVCTVGLLAAALAGFIVQDKIAYSHAFLASVIRLGSISFAWVSPLTMLCWLAVLKRFGGKYIAVPMWQRVPLTCYVGTTSPEAQTIIDVAAKTSPEISFFVEELWINKVRVDPLLGTYDEKGHAIYVAAWDEPEFEEVMTTTHP